MPFDDVIPSTREYLASVALSRVLVVSSDFAESLFRLTMPWKVSNSLLHVGAAIYWMVLIFLGTILIPSGVRSHPKKLYWTQSCQELTSGSWNLAISNRWRSLRSWSSESLPDIRTSSDNCSLTRNTIQSFIKLVVEDIWADFVIHDSLGWGEHLDSFGIFKEDAAEAEGLSGCRYLGL